jgi:solute carrier family 25 carnitine/acylcarnitine transporter 20/29
MSPVELIKVKQQVIGVDLLKTSTQVTRGLLSQASWKGLGATLLRDGIPHGVWFASYQACKDVLDAKIGGTAHHDNVTVPLTSGAFAATIAWVRMEHYWCNVCRSCHALSHFHHHYIIRPSDIPLT